jgi:xylulokinase
MKSALGIDIGTSSLKALVLGEEGVLFSERIAYEGSFPEAYFQAFLKALSQLPPLYKKDIGSLSFSGQVGTYILEGKEVVPWSSPLGKEELSMLRKKLPDKLALSEIGMLQPSLVSYPLPRLLAFKKSCKSHTKVAFPKDYLLERLSGKSVSDVYSWRGLANPSTGRYSEKLLSLFGLSFDLPTLVQPTDVIGVLGPAVADKTGLSPFLPLVCGCNDFYAALLGMGIEDDSYYFEVGGTSEHLGYLSKKLIPDPRYISGPYFAHYATYGGTASSGLALSLADALEKTPLRMEEIVQKDPPIFLPYLQGERCPVNDPFAQGVYFGLHGAKSEELLAYSALEGVAFSLYQIRSLLPRIPAQGILSSGGRNDLTLFNRLKATLFGLPVIPLEEKEASALGAALLARNGLKEASPHFLEKPFIPKKSEAILPEKAYRSWLLERYTIYEQLYPRLRTLFKRKEEIKL